MDAEAASTFFEQVHSTWIKPEVERRASLNTLPTDFKIYRARILLPKGAQPVVAFNDEIAWLCWMDVGEPGSVNVGDLVYWDQVRRIKSVAAPLVDGAPVAFVYLFKVTKGYQFIFDFSPNLPDEIAADLPPRNWDETFGPAIASTLQDGLVERSVHLDEMVTAQLSALGLWPAPALVPFPFRDIVRRVAEGDTEGARRTLVTHCNPAFIASLSEAWWNAPEFAHRRTLLSEAVRAHSEGRFVLSIPALLPQLEGLITDWMIRTSPNEALPFRQEPKTKKFRETLLKTEGKSFVFRRVVEASLQFILEGPVLSSFQQWHDAISGVFPHRHVVEHGRHEDALYTEENSLKLILLLDSLHFMMAGRALRSDDAV
jgi:hypothetical protein